MAEKSEEQADHIIDIPKLFYSDLTGAPIEKCISCESSLLDAEIPYLIEKAIKPYQGFESFSTVFEYAMCMSCAASMNGRISKSSAAKITAYFTENIDFQQREGLRIMGSITPVSEWVGQCLIKNAPVEGMVECQLYAQCIGDQMILGEFPYMVGGEALDEIIDCLSAETLDELDGMKDELIGPSEFQDLLQSGPKVFI